MDYSKQIEGYEREISINEELIELEYQHLGSTAWENSAVANAVSDKEWYAKVSQRCSSLAEEKNAILEMLRKAERLKAQQEDYRLSITSRKEEAQNLLEKLEQLLENVGSQAFDLYTKAPQQYIHYSATFAKLDELFRKRYDLEHSISKLAKESRPLFQRMLLQGKIGLLKQTLRKTEQKTTGLFREAGQQISDDWLAAAGNDEKLAKILLPVLNQHQKIAEIQKIIASNQASIQKIQLARSALSENLKPGQHFKQLQLRLAKSEEELATALRQSGKVLANTPAPPPQIAKFLARIQELSDENQEKKTLIDQIRASREIGVLTERKNLINQKKEKILQQIENLHTQLHNIDTSLGNLDKKIAIQEKIRGSHKR